MDVFYTGQQKTAASHCPLTAVARECTLNVIRKPVSKKPPA
jgi:hypothetical protein